jgi:hypothetical protein
MRKIIFLVIYTSQLLASSTATSLLPYPPSRSPCVWLLLAGVCPQPLPATTTLVALPCLLCWLSSTSHTSSSMVEQASGAHFSIPARRRCPTSPWWACLTSLPPRQTCTCSLTPCSSLCVDSPSPIPVPMRSPPPLTHWVLGRRDILNSSCRLAANSGEVLSFLLYLFPYRCQVLIVVHVYACVWYWRRRGIPWVWGEASNTTFVWCSSCPVMVIPKSPLFCFIDFSANRPLVILCWYWCYVYMCASVVERTILGLFGKESSSTSATRCLMK